MATFDPKVYKREDMAHLLHGFVDQREFAESGSAIIVEANGVRVKDIDGKTIGTPGIGSIQDAMLNKKEKKHNTNHCYYII